MDGDPGPCEAEAEEPLRHHDAREQGDAPGGRQEEVHEADHARPGREPPGEQPDRDVFQPAPVEEQVNQEQEPQQRSDGLMINQRDHVFAEERQKCQNQNKIQQELVCVGIFFHDGCISFRSRASPPAGGRP